MVGRPERNGSGCPCPRRRTVEAGRTGAGPTARGRREGIELPEHERAADTVWGRPLRTFFAFDPRRSAILLIGGDKTGDARFYERMIPLADGLYETHLDELRKEGLI